MMSPSLKHLISEIASKTRSVATEAENNIYFGVKKLGFISGKVTSTELMQTVKDFGTKPIQVTENGLHFLAALSIAYGNHHSEVETLSQELVLGKSIKNELGAGKWYRSTDLIWNNMIVGQEQYSWNGKEGQAMMRAMPILGNNWEDAYGVIGRSSAWIIRQAILRIVVETWPEAKLHVMSHAVAQIEFSDEQHNFDRVQAEQG